MLFLCAHIKTHVSIWDELKITNPKHKTSNKKKIFTWLLFNLPTLLPSYLFAYLGKYVASPSFYLPIYLCMPMY